MSPEQELMNILFQGEMEIAMKRIMSYEIYDEAVRMYRDSTKWIVSYSKPDKTPELCTFSTFLEAKDKFDMYIGFIRLRLDDSLGKDQTNS